MELQAVYDKILVEIIQQATENKTKSGIILPDAPPPAFSRGRVISKGDGTYQNGVRIDMDVDVGDEILYNPNVAYPIELSEKNLYVIISDRDVVAIAKKGE